MYPVRNGCAPAHATCYGLASSAEAFASGGGEGDVTLELLLQMQINYHMRLQRALKNPRLPR